MLKMAWLLLMSAVLYRNNDCGDNDHCINIQAQTVTVFWQCTLWQSSTTN